MIESNDAVKVNTDILDKLYRTLKTNRVTARVGILGDKNVRTQGAEKSNATIGAEHEYGVPSKGLVQRSFLRMPLTEFLPKELAKAGFFNEALFKETIEDGDLKKYVEKVAIAGVAVVLQAFDSRGFGRWKESNMDFKKVKQTLVETGQLRDSIDYEVK